MLYIYLVALSKEAKPSTPTRYSFQFINFPENDMGCIPPTHEQQPITRSASKSKACIGILQGQYKFHINLYVCLGRPSQNMNVEA